MTHVESIHRDDGQGLYLCPRCGALVQTCYRRSDEVNWVCRDCVNVSPEQRDLLTLGERDPSIARLLEA